MLRGKLGSTTGSAQHLFSRAPQANIPRSKFNRSHGVKTTFDEGYLVPILADEMLPGDTFSLNMHAFARLNTPLFPIMDNIYLETFFFAVPYRLVWDHWEEFNGFQANPGDSTEYEVPHMDIVSAPVGSLFDYFGIPTGISGTLHVNSLHFRAYNLIWNEWFRDENLQDSVVVATGDIEPIDISYGLLKRGKRYDYFTSCLPFPQKGPDVTLPLGSTAPIVSDGTQTFVSTSGGDRGLNLAGSPSVNSNLFYDTPVLGAAEPFVFSATQTGLEVDLSDATAATINDLRLAFQTQKLYERDARGGTRYTEIIRSHFGVISPDARLQRPEYLGGGSSPVLVSPIAQTTPEAGDSPLGRLGAYGTCAPHNHGFTYSATEHCLIIGLVSTRADLNYQAGLDRMWSRRTRLDYYWPALSHIGEQAVLNQEIFAQSNGAINDDVFGYQERYAEYRYKPSMITGEFRSNATPSLDVWHLAQDFAELPVLNSEFIEENAPMSRIMAVPNSPDFIFDCFFQYHCVRPMPVYSVPGLVDHF